MIICVQLSCLYYGPSILLIYFCVFYVTSVIISPKRLQALLWKKLHFDYFLSCWALPKTPLTEIQHHWGWFWMAFCSFTKDFSSSINICFLSISTFLLARGKSIGKAQGYMKTPVMFNVKDWGAYTLDIILLHLVVPLPVPQAFPSHNQCLQKGGHEHLR